ncbi:MAG: PilZ domain-containing protein [Formivibrio sp.]|nr:PilZ domain-containing protein [Formivibrio sp.]
MSQYKSWQDSRSARRVPVHFRAKICPADFGPTQYGECTDLSVGGMTLQTSYVPQPQEEFEVYLVPPRIATEPVKPFVARVRVVRCHEIEHGQLYELGLLILEVLR